MKTFLKYAALAIFIIVLFLLSQSVFADKRYNPYEQRWEITTEDAELRYNPYTGERRFTPPDSRFEYNPYEDEWGAPGESNTSDDYYDGVDYDY